MYRFGKYVVKYLEKSYLNKFLSTLEQNKLITL